MIEHRHLRRLDFVWLEQTIYFVTVCARDRHHILANDHAYRIIRAEFESAPARHQWRVGRYVLMPDHVHFFCASDATSGASSLSRFVGAFKKWTAKALIADGAARPIWQKQFFDHVLRKRESYSNKWEYMRENPVRAGLVRKAEDWPYAGEIEPLEM